MGSWEDTQFVLQLKTKLLAAGEISAVERPVRTIYKKRKEKIDIWNCIMVLMPRRDIKQLLWNSSPPTVSNSCLLIYEQLNENEIIVSAPTFDAQRFSHPITCVSRIIKRFNYSSGSSQPITLSLLWQLTLSFSHVRLGFLGGEPCRSMLSSLIKQWLFSPFQTTSCQGLWF